MALPPRRLDIELTENRTDPRNRSRQRHENQSVDLRKQFPTHAIAPVRQLPRRHPPRSHALDTSPLPWLISQTGFNRTAPGKRAFLGAVPWATHRQSVKPRVRPLAPRLTGVLPLQHRRTPPNCAFSFLMTSVRLPDMADKLERAKVARVIRFNKSCREPEPDRDRRLRGTCEQWIKEGKGARSTSRSSFGLPEMTAVVRAAKRPCQNAAKAQKSTTVRGSSGESRLEGSGRTARGGTRAACAARPTRRRSRAGVAWLSQAVGGSAAAPKAMI